MSYSDSQPHFTQPCYQSGSDAIGIWPQFSMSGMNEQFDQPPYKRAKNSDDDNSVHLTNSRLPSNPPVNRGTTCIFFKTRMCAKFKTGTCRNGENCNFAHGMQDLRQPPPNWQELAGVGSGGGGGGGRVDEDNRPSPAVNWEDDQRIIHKMKLCKKFCNGEECPYGDRCNFLHEDPAKFRSDAAGRFRESAAISIGTTGMPMVHHGNGGGYSAGEVVVRPAQSGGSDPLRVANNVKPVYWKTRLCSKFEITGHCPFGEKCHFAHGLSELHANGGRLEGDSASQGTILSKPSVFGNGGNPSSYMTSGVAEESEGGKKCLVKWNGRKKINRIYGDWLDDLPLAQNLTNVQS